MAKLLKWVTFIFELFLAVPFVGALYILGSNSWIALLAAAVLNAVALVVLKKNDLPTTGNVFALVSAIIGFVPILGEILHGTAVILLLIEVVVMHMKEEKQILQS